MATTSPNWKRPADTMMLRRSKKRNTTVLQRRHLTPNHSPHDSPNSAGNAAGQSQKRRNPFSCPERKRVNTGSSDSAPDCAPHALFEVLDAAAKDAEGKRDMKGSVASPQCGPDRVMEALSLEENTHTVEPIHTASQQTQEKDEVKTIEWTASFPTDWSLKRKLRFVSDKSFSWCCPLRTAEEAAGVSNFVRCQSRNSSQEFQLSVSDKAELHRCCMVWTHPHLPWLNLFPRIVSDNRIGKVCVALQTEDIQKALMADWTDSFTSVFRLVQARHCPYFYLCTHQMTALFRAGGIAGFPHTHAIVTPTSRGFREALRKEGIEFSMPLNDRNREKAEDESCESSHAVMTDRTTDTHDTTGEAVSQEEEEEEEDIMQSDGGAHSWLQDLGLDKAQFRSLDPNKVKLERETFRVIDRRPESLVLVEGADTLALFNYLLNCHSCVASTGVQAGLPPTLLAPVAFKGATLETLKVKQCAVRQQQTDGSLQIGHSLEVTGPVLPHSVDGLNRLLANSHSYTCVYSTHEPTVPFNCVSRHNVSGDTDTAVTTHQLMHSGISSEHLDNITENKTHLGNRALREFACDDRGLFHWVL